MNREDDYGSHYIDEARAVGEGRQQHAAGEWLAKSESMLLNDNEVLFGLDGIDFEHSIAGLHAALEGRSEFYMLAARACCHIHLAMSELSDGLVSHCQRDATNAVKKIGSRTMALSSLFNQSTIQRAGTVARQRSSAGGTARAQIEAPARRELIAIYRNLIDEIRAEHPGISKTELARKVYYKFAANHCRELEGINQQYDTNLSKLTVNTLRQTYC